MQPVLFCLLFGAVKFALGVPTPSPLESGPSSTYLSIYDVNFTAPDWSGLCQTGKMQSPVLLEIFNDQPPPSPGAIVTNWSTSAIVNVSNPDHDTPQINFPAGSTTTFSFSNATGKIVKTLNLVQLHWHHKSEHAFNGTHADLEAHFVHVDPLTGLNTVLAYLLWNGTTPDPALEIALQYEPTEYSFDATGERVWVANKVPQPLNLETLFAPFLGGPFAYYVGSLTTPPCTENVEWIVYTSYFEVSAEQLTAFDAYVQEGNGPNGNDYNERPDQPLNGRVVEYVGISAA